MVEPSDLRHRRHQYFPGLYGCFSEAALVPQLADLEIFVVLDVSLMVSLVDSVAVLVVRAEERLVAGVL